MEVVVVIINGYQEKEHFLCCNKLKYDIIEI